MMEGYGATIGTPTPTPTPTKTKTPVTSGLVSSVTQRYRDTDTHDNQETHRNAVDTLSPSSECLKNQSMSITEVVNHALTRHEGYEYEYEGEYRTPLWDFTRAVKGFFIDGTDPDMVFNFIEDEISNRGGWTTLEPPIEADEVYEEFICTWDAIRVMPEQETLRRAFDLAIGNPLLPERAAKRPGGLQGYSEFVSVAGWAQVLRGDQPIYLPCNKLDELLGTYPMRIKRWRDLAIKDEYIQKVKEGSYVKRRADEFIFDVTQFPELAQGVKASEE